MTHRTLWIQPAAPVKPAFGAACNGCGVCCLVAPCPVGIVLSRKRSGACSALRWDDAATRYVCGAAAQPHRVFSGLPRLLANLAGRMARRLISAGSGCDADIDVERFHR